MKWWQKAVFYQIYPRSFADGNGDGIGDLEGMISKLDTLKDLGIDAIWLSPHFPSPQVDCGYDISDYTGVAPEYGTLDTFKRFLKQAHQRGMRLILDLVLNHTSDQHPWFQESRSSLDNPKRDWYIWRDGKNGGPPNNWFSGFGGSAWEYEDRTGQYYYHYFFKQQPDLNWRNPDVKEAMWNAARFWLDMGVDGFRLDAVGTIFEDPALPEQTSGISLDQLHKMMRLATTEEEETHARRVWMRMFHYQHDLPGVHDLMRELRNVVDKYPDRVLVGETDEISYYGNGTDELQLVFNFPLMRTHHLSPGWVRTNQEERLGAIPTSAWPCNTLGNHDSPRVYSRFGDGLHDVQLARLHLALMLTLRGTPFLYNGEEIGMSDTLILDADKFRDPLGTQAYRLEMELLKANPEDALRYSALNGRDKCRTPFQWSNSANAGFSPAVVEPWLPVNPNYAQGVNYEDEKKQPASLLNFYRSMLRVRKEIPALIEGDYGAINQDAERFLAFLRGTSTQKVLVILNFSDEEIQPAPGVDAHTARLLFSSREGRDASEAVSGLRLTPYEVYIAELV